MGASPRGRSLWGMAIFEAESWDKILEVFSHPEYQRVVYPDEKVIIDRSRTQVFAGEFATLLERSRFKVSTSLLSHSHAYSPRSGRCEIITPSDSLVRSVNAVAVKRPSRTFVDTLVCM